MSVSKGKFQFLIRKDQIDRKRKQTEGELKYNNAKLTKIEELNHKVASLKEKIDAYARNELELLLVREKLAKLYMEGAIDSDEEIKD